MIRARCEIGLIREEKGQRSREEDQPEGDGKREGGV
jgi:hypothetical protein